MIRVHYLVSSVISYHQFVHVKIVITEDTTNCDLIFIKGTFKFKDELRYFKLT